MSFHPRQPARPSIRILGASIPLFGRPIRFTMHCRSTSRNARATASTFRGAYTWGKSIDTLSATEANDAFPNGLFNQLFFDQRTSRGLSDFNVAQDFVLSFTWEIPSPASSSKLSNGALG